ncbi:hypothetical protein N7U66_02940 [Lacinutrix neustonica]|uniref:Uncharacterized protein n=1 Tax=Lacinutrix neustonica TaxID=2980107 RepID=A0A9E8MYL8_9FLAO|nr:hypothetical protein [Lacinutrix neustonica]WAC02655.1 hypothetical protein N7U66_02940 [Lacinutrix neustonica]
MSHAHSYDAQPPKQAQESPLAYEEVTEDNNEDYSDANAYFENDAGLVKQQSNQQAPAPRKKNTLEAEEPNKEATVAHEAVVMQPEDVLDEAAIREQDKKFEEDIQSILTGKKQFDKAGIEKDPEEAVKDQNHGVFNKKDNRDD